jgi:peptidoglycan lytic transglycosylase G
MMDRRPMVRRPPPPRPANARVMRKLPLLFVILLLMAAAAGAAEFKTQERGDGGRGKEVVVDVPDGSTGASIASIMASSKVVSSSFAFQLFLRIKGTGSGLKAGEYKLREKMPYSQLLAALEKGPSDTFVKLTIPEGSNAAQTAARAGASTHISKEDFLAAATANTVRPAILPPPVDSLEGFLYPKTYFVIKREMAPELVRRLVAQFGQETAGLPWNRAQQLGRTRYEVLIIASMTEEEAKAPSERPMIAAVIYNRLHAGMKLGIDATVQYAVGKFSGEPLTQSDLEVDSPYNTRKFAGLPPAPIDSPTAGAIQAALVPAQTGALYFVLTADCKTHFFTSSFKEFERAQQQQPRNC